MLQAIGVASETRQRMVISNIMRKFHGFWYRSDKKLFVLLLGAWRFQKMNIQRMNIIVAYSSRFWARLMANEKIDNIRLYWTAHRFSNATRMPKFRFMLHYRFPGIVTKGFTHNSFEWQPTNEFLFRKWLWTV